METRFSLDTVLMEVKRLLPLQNPLFSFLHNNALQAFEERPFFDGIYEASQLYRARTLPSGVVYRSEYQKGLIDYESLQETIVEYLKKKAETPIDAKGLHYVLTVPVKYQVPMPRPASLRSARFWEEEYSFPFRKTLQDWLIPFLQSYLDQGQALHLNPYRGDGLVRYFVESSLAVPKWLRDERYLAAKRLHRSRDIPLQKQIELELIRTGLSPDSWQEYLLELLFDLKGWSGMIQRLASDADQRIAGYTQISTEEWLLVLLTLERTLHMSLCSKMFKQGRRIADLKLQDEILEITQGDRILDVLPDLITRQQNFQPLTFLAWLRKFGERDRFEIWQRAAELSEEKKVLARLRSHFLYSKHTSQSVRPDAHFMFCIDDREESIRRHLEAQNPKIVTSGVVGFFGLDMRFKSIHHPKPIRQCPPVVNPKFLSQEYLPTGKDPSLSWSSKLGNLAYRASRTAGRGWVFSLFFGHLSLMQMLLRIAVPALHRKMYLKLKEYFEGNAQTVIQSDFDLFEQANRVELICRMAGIHDVSQFPPIVFVVSHGSTTHNNPYRQAYGCGACSGNSGAPNARLFVQFANDIKVREYLKSQKGFIIPESVRFIASHHDTCSDEFVVSESGLELTVQKLVDQLMPDIVEATRRNAFERLRILAPHQDLSVASALNAAKVRSLDLAQPRPEYGHSSVALAIFGKRSLTQAIDLKRQSFLVSYDPAQDEDGKILTEVLIGALPVCANIGLDYFFSAADPDRLGAGSKLPLNITSLLGVMTGSRSDLRIGLARQMTEIHRCLRMKIFIEAHEALLVGVLHSHPRLNALWKNEWVMLYRVDPNTMEISRLLCR